MKRRIDRIARNPRKAKSRLGPVVGACQTPLLEISELAYVELVD